MILDLYLELAQIDVRHTIIVILILFSIAVIVLAAYGSVRICTLQERFDTIKIQQVEIDELKAKIYQLKQTNTLPSIIYQNK